MPALTVVGSDAKADLSASRMISHLLGLVASTRWGFASQSAVLVMGGKLQFMLPLRSITKSKLAGKSSALMVEDAHPLASLGPAASAPGTMIPVPPEPPEPPVPPSFPLPPLPPPPLPPLPPPPATP